tara:strand:+ start:4198 stop:5943 length:1746 start_codon:yes stop_codon:yes gene_type:complete
MKSLYLKELFLIVDKKRRIQSIGLILLMIIASLLELLSYSMVIPLISVIRGEEITFAPINLIMEFFNVNDTLIFICVLTFSCFFIKTLYLIFLAYAQGYFSASIFAELAKKLSIYYSGLQYLDFISSDSAEKIRNVTNESKMIMQGYMKPLFLLFNESFVVICFVAFLIIYQPVIFLLLIGFFIFSASAIYSFSRIKLRILGNKRVIFERSFLKYIQESLFAFKEIKLSDSNKFYLEKINNAVNDVAKINRQDYFLKQIPRPMLEFVLIAAITMLVWASSTSIIPNSGSDILSILSIFVAAAFRILPSITRIIGSLQNINFFKTSLILYVDKFKEKSFEKNKIKQNYEGSSYDFIEVKNLSFSYEENKKPIFENIDLSISKNDFVGVIGPSGSGKSTFLYILMTLIQPSSGTIFNNGEDIFFQEKNWRLKLGYVPQDPYMIDDNVLNNIIFGSNQDNPIDMKKIESVLKMANLNKTIESLPDGLNTIIGENAVFLSGGQKQRLSIARALYRSPEILILDEATSSLDKDSENEIIDEISNLSGNITIVMSTHKENTLKNCNKIIEVNQGSIKIRENFRRQNG